MHKDHAKMYPVAGPNPQKPGVLWVAQGTNGTIDLSKTIEDVIFITMTDSSSTSFNIINPQVGMTIVIEQNSTGTNTHSCTFTGYTINAAGNNVIATDADDESIILTVISATRMVIISNNGSVALS